MVDLTKPVRTRDGREAIILTITRKCAGNEFPVVALITGGDGNQICSTFTLQGKLMGDRAVANPKDLVNIPAKRRGFVNVYDCNLHATQDLADHASYSPRLATLQVEFEVQPG